MSALTVDDHLESSHLGSPKDNLEHCRIYKSYWTLGKQIRRRNLNSIIKIIFFILKSKFRGNEARMLINFDTHQEII